MARDETMRRQTGRCVALLAWLLGGCAGLSDTVADLVPLARDAQSWEQSRDAGGPPTDATGEARTDGAANGASAGAPDGGVCLGSLAAQTFRHALCACDTLDLSFWGLTTDAYDSAAGPYAASRALARASHVGVNGKLTGTNPIVVGGSLVVADALGPDALPALLIQGDLRVGGPFTFSQPVDVAQNLWLASDLRGSAALHVAGNLIQAAAGTRESSPPLQLDGQDLRTPVAVGDPCPCDAGEPLDIQAFVAAAKAHNDNQLAGISPDRLDTLFTEDRIELPDGKRIFLTRIGAQLGTPVDGAIGTVTFAVEGRSVLVIESFISVGGGLSLELGPDAELDIFVGGDVSIGVLQAPPPMGNRPARVRVYVGGSYFHAQVFAETNVYAPRAGTFLLSNDLYGSLYARNILTSGGELRVHFDTSVLAEGRDCDWFDLTATP